MLKRIQNKAINYFNILEFVLSFFVVIAIIITCFTTFNGIITLYEHRIEIDTFIDYLGYIFNIFIGIEFFKMLCKPNMNMILEVLMFAFARRLIIEHSSALEGLLGVITLTNEA